MIKTYDCSFEENKRVVAVSGNIQKNKYEDLKIELIKKISQSRDSLLIVFDYHGKNNLEDDLRFYYFLKDLVEKNSDVEILGLACGICSISEVLFLQALKNGNRLSLADTSFYPMNFECSFSFSTNSNEEQTVSSFRDFYLQKKKLNGKIQEIISFKVNNSVHVDNPIKFNWGPFKLSSQEALEIGLIDEIHPILTRYLLVN